MHAASLPHRALIAVSGPDAEHLLQNVITTDLDTLAQGEAMGGALLSPQGKILFDFLISRLGSDGFRIDCRADIAADLARRLTMYRLRAKAEIVVLDQSVVQVRWQGDSAASQIDSTANAVGYRDRRFPVSAVVLRDYDAAAAQGGDASSWDAFRIASGIPESGSDYQLGDAFPHDVLLDQTRGVGLRKGCYVGQEVVSRMQHRGTARRRMLIATADGPFPPTGTEITAGGRTIGTLGSSAGGHGLALVRIDKVKAAMTSGLDLLAGGAVLSLKIPDWATFTFPEDAPTAEDV